MTSALFGVSYTPWWFQPGMALVGAFSMIVKLQTSRMFVASSSAQRRYSDGLIGPYLMQVGERGHTLSLGALALAALVALVALVPPPA